MERGSSNFETHYSKVYTTGVGKYISNLKFQDIDRLRNWTWNKKIEKKESKLTEIGHEELYDIGQRVRKRYPTLLNTTDIKKFYFRSTNKQRTIASSAAFVQGLTNGTTLKLILSRPRNRDDILKVCLCL